MAWADHLLADAGVRWSPLTGWLRALDARAFSVRVSRRMGLEVAGPVRLGAVPDIRLAGGGPFALATAAVARERVEVGPGVIAGAAPFQLVPGARRSPFGWRLELPSACSREIPRGRMQASWRGFDMTADARELHVPSTRSSSRCCPTSDRRLVEAPSLSTASADMRERCARGHGCGWTTSPGSAPGMSTPLPSSVQFCSGMAPRTGWPNRSTPSGLRKTCPTAA